MTKRYSAFSGAFKLALLSGAAALISGAAWAEDEKKDKDEEKKKKGPPTIEKKTEDFDKSEGLFTFYTDPETGDVYMEIGEDQLGEEFIAWTYAENGILEGGAFRGAYRDERILTVKKHYKNLEFVEQNTSFYFDPDNAISRAADANISPAIVASVKIEAITPADDEEEGAEDNTDESTEAGADESATAASVDRYLIKANGLFLSEKLHQIKPSPRPGVKPEPGAFSLGSLSKSKTKFAEIRTYPENADIVVDYVYDSPLGKFASPAVTDSRSVTLKLQHSFIAMPDDGFEPRFDDYRVGYFHNQVTDLTSRDSAPYRDLINRWRLEKKDPEAEISDPVKPITWWIENTTPEEYRDTIRDAVLAWNQSFEKAGFSNAVEVKVQPDDAGWDAGDIRYNVLRWTSSPIPPFGGYGPSFTNPRTGEIIGADIMLEYSFITNRWVFGESFEAAGLSGNHETMPGAHHHDNDHFCSFGHHLAMGNMFGAVALAMRDADPAASSELVKESIYYLMLHEVGHTLGLNHNMKASSLYAPDEVHDPSVTQGAPTGSVMDYPAINIAPDGVEQGDYYMTRPGPYDDWAIEFGYRPDLDDEARAALLARSVEPGNTFGNDADDMRAPGKAIDPRVNISDMSSDPVAYGVDRIKLVQKALPGLLDKFGDEASWQNLMRAYLVASGQQASMGNVFSRQIGGVYVDRTAPGQEGGLEAPYTAVPYKTQKAAMKALKEHIFAGDAFEISDELIAHLQPQRRGFNFFSQSEDPKVHDRVLRMQMGPIAHLLHPNVLKRLTDSSLYGNEYSPAEMLTDLNNAIIGGDLRGRPNAFRRNLQVAYVERLVSIIDNPGYDNTAQAAALAAAQDVRGRMGFMGGMFEFGLNAETKAHRAKISRILAMHGL